MAMSSGRVGIRELRQNLSVYIRQVLKGEVLEVTDRGEPVALLIPIPATRSALEELIASGRATRPKGSLNELPAPKGPISDRLSRALEELRADRF